MTDYEYKVVIAPRRAGRVKGVRRTEDRFAQKLMDSINGMARHGWEYLRADSLPCEERAGITGRVESYQTVLVFRRPKEVGDRFFDRPQPLRIEDHGRAASLSGAVTAPPVPEGFDEGPDAAPVLEANASALAVLKTRREVKTRIKAGAARRQEGWRPPRFRLRLRPDPPQNFSS